jgi:hypothetical protein
VAGAVSVGKARRHPELDFGRPDGRRGVAVRGAVVQCSGFGQEPADRRREAQRRPCRSEHGGGVMRIRDLKPCSGLGQQGRDRTQLLRV